MVVFICGNSAGLVVGGNVGLDHDEPGSVPTERKNWTSSTSIRSFGAFNPTHWSTL